MAVESGYDNYKYSKYFKIDLPEHWEEKRLGYLAAQERTAFVDGPFGSDLKTNDYKDSGVPLIQLNNIRDSKHLLQNMKFVTDKKKNQLIRHVAIPGDVVIAKMAEPVARCAIVSDEYTEYVIVADCVKLTPNLKLIDLRYLVWAINSDQVKINAELVSTGTTRIRVNLGELKKLKIPYPTIDEQQKIANFLDHATARIDTLIEKQQQLIKLLKEKRQAVISHTVTRGLNPKAPMRDSGVEWLGEVPAHWKVLTVRNLIRAEILEIQDGNHGEQHPVAAEYVDEGIPFLMANNVRNGKVLSDECKYISLERSNKLRIGFAKPNDVLLTHKGTVGEVGLIPDDIDEPFWMLTPQVTYYRWKHKDYFNKYFYMLFQSVFYQEQLTLIGGKQSTRAYVGLIAQGDVLLTVPPRNEQEDIFAELARSVGKYENLIAKAKTTVRLLEERRTALISAAVTGKIDVRNWLTPKASSADVNNSKSEHEPVTTSEV